uniref:Uncharacterized protein n=1 Tax=Amphimedon queenslandica TaxID=400682 RepID=A0A1X7UCL9_AMPQE
EEDYRTKESLKDMIEQYIARAEYLKSLVRTQKPSLRDTAGENRKRILEEMQAEFSQLKDVHSLIEEADQLEDRHSYHSA